MNDYNFNYVNVKMDVMNDYNFNCECYECRIIVTCNKMNDEVIKRMFSSYLINYTIP